MEIFSSYVKAKFKLIKNQTKSDGFIEGKIKF